MTSTRRSGIGLMMIVKNEAPVIERCLASVRPFVDWWVIADTGSSDDTVERVRRALEGIPGEVVERPWVDFGHNRQEVLDLARGSAHRGEGDYAMWIDADEQLVGQPLEDHRLTHDGYHLQVEYDATRYQRLAVISLDRPWRWVGPIHEHLDLPGAVLGELSTPTVLVTHDGHRAQDPDTYRRDAAVIEAALRDEPDDPRLLFYLAQSWKDAGEPEKALDAYRVRAAHMGGWSQEQWYSLFQAARMLERLDRPVVEVCDALLSAHQACSWRAEPLVELARLERSRERFEVALLYARAASLIAEPVSNALFVDADTYRWRAWDELAVSCYWTARYEEGLRAAELALAARPGDARLQANVEWCRSGLTT